MTDNNPPTFAKPPITLAETSRTYVFPGGDEVKLDNVIELAITSTHRIKTADGRLHIIPRGWIAIHIVDPTNSWTV